MFRIVGSHPLALFPHMRCRLSYEASYVRFDKFSFVSSFA